MFTYSSVLNINYVRSEILVSCLVYFFFKQIVDICFNKAYYQESYILIIENSSVVTVLLFLNIWILTFYCFRLKNVLGLSGIEPLLGFSSLLWLSKLSSNHSATVTTLLFSIISEKNRLYLDISSVPNVHMWSVWFVITCGRFVSCFCIARIHFKSSHARQFWT
jgi:hypothetical protein